MKLISFNLSERYLEHLDRLIEEERFPNRSEAIRVAIRDLIMKEYELDQKTKKEERE
ncbi:MAG: putative nickel-responsive regulator [Promethearchaeota archaeon]|nr:MAG: putative nickel-responsive regulator [Candidatus Lokiarchaeota archaeon]